MKHSTGCNSGLAKAAVQCFVEYFLVYKHECFDVHRPKPAPTYEHHAQKCIHKVAAETCAFFFRQNSFYHSQSKPQRAIVFLPAIDCCIL